MGRIYIIAGTSGSGKSTIASRLLTKYPNIRRTVSVTTRAPRDGERYGIDYFFVNLELFDWLRQSKQLLEYTTYDNNMYGTLRSTIEKLLADGHDVVCNLDRIGIEALLAEFENVRSVFLRTESQEEQHKRLSLRGMDRDALNGRIQIAEDEISWAESHGLPIITTTRDIDRTVREVEAVLFE